MKAEEAVAKAKKIRENVEFEHWEGDDSTGWSGSEVGIAYPCGCISYSTILSDGSLGIGGWDDPCSFEHMTA
jgi:hypothetical protein